MTDGSTEIAIVSSDRLQVTCEQCLTIIQVGIAAQLPAGSFADGDLDYSSFFDFLLQRGEAYGDIPKERFNAK